MSCPRFPHTAPKDTKMAKTETTSRIPKRVCYGSGMSTMVGQLFEQMAARTYIQAGNGQRTVLGFPIPEWQRELCWTEAQCERFIQSVYAGIYLGLYVYNDTITSAPKLDGLLIDGQQRLHALERYLAGELAVTGPDGGRYRWTDLNQEEQAHFNRMPFGFEIVSITDEAQLKQLYNLLNFGGVPHADSQRAV